MDPNKKNTSHPMVTSMDFQPLKPWPEDLPGITWKEYAIAGFASSKKIDCSDTPLEKLIGACYPELSLAEIARLFQLTEEHMVFTSSQFDEVPKAYGYQPNRLFYETLRALAQTPLEFQNWTSAKKIGVQDLYFLMTLPEISLFESFLTQIARLNVSKNLGKELLMLGSELFLQDRPIYTLLPLASENEVHWYQKLKKLRFPISSNNESLAESTIDNVAWPKYVQSKVSRRGDQTGLEIKLFVTSKEDFNKKVKNLESLIPTDFQ